MVYNGRWSSWHYISQVLLWKISCIMIIPARPRCVQVKHLMRNYKSTNWGLRGLTSNVAEAWTARPPRVASFCLLMAYLQGERRKLWGFTKGWRRSSQTGGGAPDHLPRMGRGPSPWEDPHAHKGTPNIWTPEAMYRAWHQGPDVGPSSERSNW